MKRVETTQEAVLDSAIFLNTVDLVAKKAQKLKVGTIGFDMGIFIAKLKTSLKSGDSQYDLSKLNNRVRKACSIIPAIDFMSSC